MSNVKCPPLLGDHLRPNQRRRYGKQDGKLVPCARKPDLHGHHPNFEFCPACRDWSEEAAEVDTVRPPPPAMRSLGQQLYEWDGLVEWDYINSEVRAYYEKAAEELEQEGNLPWSR